MDPEQAKARDVVADAEALARSLLPRLPAEAFFPAAHAALAAAGSMDELSVARAVDVAAALAAASGSLGLTFAIGYGFENALRVLSPHGAGARVASTRPLGVVAFGAFSGAAGDPAHGAERLEITGTVDSVAGALDAGRVVLVGTIDGGSHFVALVGAQAPGVALDPSTNIVGFDRIAAGSIRFDRAVLGPGSLLVQGPAAMAAARRLRDAERTLTAAVAVGVGRHAFRVAVEHLRTLGTRPSQSTEFSLSDVATDLDAAELSARRAARLWDAGAGAALESASAKHLAAGAATKAAHTALGIAAGGTYTGELRECYLDARSLESRAGTAAELVDTIASEMLGES